MSPFLATAIGITFGAGMWPVANKYLRDFQAQSKSLAEEVQWAILATGGLVWNKDGSLMAAWEFSGPDLTYATTREADVLAGQVEKALMMLDRRFMLHVDSVRIPSCEYASASHSPTPVGQFVEAKRRRRYESGRHYENRCFVALTFEPPEEKRRRARSLLYTDFAEQDINWKHEIENFEKHLVAFQDRMPPLSMERLCGEDLLSYLNLMITGRSQSVNPPDGPAFLDFLFADPLSHGFEPKLGDKWVRVVGIQGYAKEAFVGIAEPLLSLPFPYRFSNRLIGIDQSDAKGLIKKRMNRWSMKRQDMRSQMRKSTEGDPSVGDDLFANQHAGAQARDAAEARSKLQAGTSRMFHHTACVLVYHEDLKTANDRARRVEKTLRNAGFVAQRERGLATEALMGSWPGHGQKNVRRYPILSEYACRLLPLTAIYPGPEENSSSLYPEHSPPLFYAKTQENVPFRFCPYVGDVGHQIIIGPTGSGKSILMGFQAMRHLQHAGGQAILLDAGNSFAPLCEALGGTRYDVAGAEEGTSAGFQPLHGIEEPEERRWALSWVLTLIKLQGVEVTPTLRKTVARTLETMATPRRSGGRDYRTLHELKTQVQSKEVKDALQPYCAGGSLGSLLDAEEDAFESSRFQVLELSSLLELRKEIYTPILLYLFHRIERMLEMDRPTYVGADEFFMFAARTDVGRKYALEALRTYRKKNAMMTIATQSPTDVIGEKFSGILNSCRTRILLPNPDALDPAQRRSYEQIGLSEAEIRAISEAVPKREYVSKQPGGTRTWNLGLDVELAFMTAADDLSLLGTAEKMHAFKDEYGSAWVEEWLRFWGYEGPPDLASPPALS